ncbi:hypothetical protein BHE74_00031786, partial [Ensete ventricosum]
MAPKKKQQRASNKAASKAKLQSADAKPAPKLQISAENERRLRRLLLNTERPAAAEGPSVAAADAASRPQKAKRLRAVATRAALAPSSPAGFARGFFSPRAGRRNVSPRGREFEA